MNTPVETGEESRLARLQEVLASGAVRGAARLLRSLAPVVDQQGHLLGRITVDDAVDVIREEGEHQFMGHAGLSEEEDMFAPVLAGSVLLTTVTDVVGFLSFLGLGSLFLV